MKRFFWAASAVALIGFAAWRVSGSLAARRYARPAYDVELFDAKTFTVEIPKGWRRPDYADPRESKTEFTTSTNSRDEGDPYYVQSRLHIEDYGPQAAVDQVVADWRKDGTGGLISHQKLGSVDAATWTSVIGYVDVSGESRTFVFRGSNGRVYSGYYELSRPGPHRMRQDYVFGRILASMKFHDPAPPHPAPR